MYPNLAGNMGSCCSGALISIVVTLLKPDIDFDWSETKRINPRGKIVDQVEHMPTPTESNLMSDSLNTHADVIEDPVKEKSNTQATIHTVDHGSLEAPSVFSGEQRTEDHETLQRSLRAAIWASIMMSLIIVFVRQFRFLVGVHIKRLS